MPIQQESIQQADHLCQLGHALETQEQLTQALAHYQQAQVVCPTYAQAAYDAGRVLMALERHTEGMANYDLALKLQPHYPEARFNQALYFLSQGNLREGLPLYESRWDIAPAHKMSFAKPQWTGQETLTNKTILIWAEQGYGDVIQYCRYCALLADRGAQVVLAVQKELLPALHSVPGVHHIRQPGQVLPVFDYHCPLLSLPLAFGTELHTIPCQVPYIFADRQHLANWVKRLGPRTGKPRIALAWAGRPLPPQRTVALGTLARIVIDNAELFSLQQSIPSNDQEAFDACGHITHFGEHLTDFAQSAALIECMDLVISIDTSVAHLAGAMGKPLWLLLPKSADWRWLSERNDSPWYPTARLFRQQAAGNWHGVVDTVMREMRMLINK